MNVKAIVKKLFPSVVNLRNRMYNAWKHARFKGMKSQEVFETIYRENHWNDSESVSGTGSNSDQTAVIVQKLPLLFKQRRIKSILDLPCGDFNWMKHVPLEGIRYIGADIVRDLIQRNKEKYESAGRSFFVGNLIQGGMPQADLFLCRDLFVHLSYADIKSSIRSIIGSKCTYLLVTTFPNHANYDIVAGNWRPVNLQSKPFNFPKPLEIIHEGFEKDERFSDKALGLWKIADLEGII